MVAQIVRIGVNTYGKLSEFIVSLQRLEAAGHGDLPVYSTEGSSGVTSELSHGFVRECTGQEECGPFDIDAGDSYISIYAGN